jgi:hypothetical protein
MAVKEAKTSSHFSVPFHCTVQQEALCHLNHMEMKVVTEMVNLLALRASHKI